MNVNAENRTGALTIIATDGWRAWTTLTTEVSLDPAPQTMTPGFDANGVAGGDPARGRKRGIARTSGCTIVNSHLAETQAVGQESPAIGGADTTFDHNTTLVDGASTVYTTSRMSVGFVFTNNVINDTAYAVKGDGVAAGHGIINASLPGRYFSGGLFIGAPPANDPAGNFYPATVQVVGLVDAGAGDSRLTSTRHHRRSGTDGTDPGCDVSALAAAYGATR